MNDFIFQQKVDLTQDTEQNRYYCLNGDGDYLDDEGFSLCKDEQDKKVCAKKMTRANGTPIFLQYIVHIKTLTYISPIITKGFLSILL